MRKGYLYQRDREKIGMAHKKMVVYKNKRGTLVRMRCLVLIGHVN